MRKEVTPAIVAGTQIYRAEPVDALFQHWAQAVLTAVQHTDVQDGTSAGTPALITPQSVMHIVATLGQCPVPALVGIYYVTELTESGHL